MAMGTHERGAYAHKGVCKALRKGEKPKVQELLVDRVTVEEEKNWPTPAYRDYKGQSGAGFKARHHKDNPSTLPDMISGLLDQDSPNTNGKSRGLWPTPNDSDQYNPNLPHDIGRNYLRTEVLPDKKTTPQKGKLNPDWVEQLMGLETGWTDCDCLAME